MARKPGVVASPAVAPPEEAAAAVPSLSTTGFASRDFGMPYRHGFLFWTAGQRVHADIWLAAYLRRHGAPVDWE